MKLHTVALAAAVACAVSAPAHATVLTPGSGFVPLEDVAAAPGGAVLATFNTPVVAATWTAQFSTAVVDGPEPGVNLDFYYQITNDEGSRTALPALLAAFFSVPFDPVGPYFATDVVQTAAAFGPFLPGAQAAAYAERSVIGYVGFLFASDCECAGLLDPGDTSYTFIVRTNASAYDTSGLIGIPDGQLTFAPAFQPAGLPPLVAPVPEPGTLALLASGLLGIAGMGRARRAARSGQ